MKIEKVNDNQIRCTLTKKDLEERQIRLKELAYGSEKAKMLFRDMIQQANYEFGFEANDIPLMIEAIPASADTIILLITKVEYPEELDTRFSRFSESDEDSLFSDEEIANDMVPSQGADDILGLFQRLKDEHKNSDFAVGEDDAGNQDHVEDTFADMIKMFEFENLDQVEHLAKVLKGFYVGENRLYKNTQKNRFLLLLHKSSHTPEEFNKICNIACEYADQKKYTPAIGAFLEEHASLILAQNALQELVLRF